MTDKQIDWKTLVSDSEQFKAILKKNNHKWENHPQVPYAVIGYDDGTLGFLYNGDQDLYHRLGGDEAGEGGKKVIQFSKESSLDRQVNGSHYKNFKIQPVEFIHANGLDFLQGNIIKYIMRHKAKHGLKDLEKAKHYIDLLIELEYGEEAI